MSEPTPPPGTTRLRQHRGRTFHLVRNSDLKLTSPRSLCGVGLSMGSKPGPGDTQPDCAKCWHLAGV